MAYKIRWTDNAIEDYEKVIEYLLADWTLSIAIEFENIVSKKLTTLSQKPFIGLPSEKAPDIRSILFTKHKRVYYRIEVDTIELLNIFDTRQHPDKNLFENG